MYFVIYFIYGSSVGDGSAGAGGSAGSECGEMVL